MNTPIALSTSRIPAPTGAITPVYQFGPEVTTFGLPVKVSFPVPAGTNGTDVAIYWTKAGSTTEWEVLPTTIAGTTATAETMHLGAGFVGAACAAGVACAPANPCHGGAMTCNQGTPICSDTGSSLPDGTICGGGNLCAAGTCEQSYAGPITIARTYTVTPPGAAPYTEADEVTQYAPPLVTRTVIDSNATIYTVRTLAFDGRAVLLSANARYQADGTPVVVYTYTPSQLVIPSSSDAGATASSTSTVTGGATTFTVTRTVTVNGVETVTVPAGTFAALKVTSSLSPSNGGANHIVNWWAAGVGMVRAVSYLDANPSATTVTELIRYSPMVCSGTSCACNAIDLSAPGVQPDYVSAALPAPQGGTLATGTYQLTAENEYTGLGGGSGPTGETHRGVYVFDADTIQFASSELASPAAGDRGTVGYEISGSELILTPLCGRGPADGEHVEFTASAGELRLISPAEPGSPTLGWETILTRQ